MGAWLKIFDCMYMPNVSTEKKESKSLFYLDTRSNLTSLQFNLMPSNSIWPLVYSLMIYMEPPLRSTDPLYLIDCGGRTTASDSNSSVSSSKDVSMYDSNSLISCSCTTESTVLARPPNQPRLERCFYNSSTLLSKIRIFITLYVQMKRVAYST